MVIEPALNVTNSTPTLITPTAGSPIGSADATWILTSAFIIFTMQSGFGLLESGLVSRKNEANIMVKNAIDVIYGGLSYWMFGFALSFGREGRNNPFCGLGYFLTDADEEEMGGVFAKYFFQLSFSTTATTIVSGAMAERANLKAYTVFSFMNTITYCFPAHWIWDNEGWLRRLGAVDIAGCSAVHLVGGVSGLVATIMLKPRAGRFDPDSPPKRMASPTNVLLGTFMLWWGWLGFNCGSTFGISGAKWMLASRSAVVTINGSIGGGIMGMLYSYTFYQGKLDISVFVTGIMGGLVSITGICSIARPWEAIIISAIGALVACSGCQLLVKLKIDDPVGCVPTHAFAAVWGLIAVGLFSEEDKLEQRSHYAGLFKGGPWIYLGVQILTIVCVAAWSSTITFLELTLISMFIPLRVSLEDELIGADRIEHGIYDDHFDMRAFAQNDGDKHREDDTIQPSGKVNDSTKNKKMKTRVVKNSFFSGLKLRSTAVDSWDSTKEFGLSEEKRQKSTSSFDVKTSMENESFQQDETDNGTRTDVKLFEVTQSEKKDDRKLTI